MCAWPLQSLNCAPFAKVPYLYGTKHMEGCWRCGVDGIYKETYGGPQTRSKLSCLLAWCIYSFTYIITLLYSSE